MNTIIKFTLFNRLEIDIRLAGWRDFGFGFHRSWRATYIHLLPIILYILWLPKEVIPTREEELVKEQDSLLFNKVLLASIEDIEEAIRKVLNKYSTKYQLKDVDMRGVGTGFYGRIYGDNRMGGYIRHDFLLDVPKQDVLLNEIKENDRV